MDHVLALYVRRPRAAATGVWRYRVELAFEPAQTASRSERQVALVTRGELALVFMLRMRPGAQSLASAGAMERQAIERLKKAGFGEKIALGARSVVRLSPEQIQQLLDIRGPAHAWPDDLTLAERGPAPQPRPDDVVWDLGEGDFLSPKPLGTVAQWGLQPCDSVQQLSHQRQR